MLNLQRMTMFVAVVESGSLPRLRRPWGNQGGGQL
jgi:hypothetical protein